VEAPKKPEAAPAKPTEPVKKAEELLKKIAPVE